MDTTAGFVGLDCRDCGARHGIDDAPGQCPDCGGHLDPAYDLDRLAVDREAFVADRHHGFAGFEPLLPVPASTLETTAVGSTPLVDCPGLADEIGVGSLRVKDEGQNPTGTVADREMALAVAVAAARGATDVALPSMGNDGQAAAAAAARHGLESHTFVPTRTPFLNKAMINVHGGDMNVGGARFADAAAAFAEALADEPWHSLAAFETPYRHESAKTLAFELCADCDWSLPDAVVCPTGHGIVLAGLHKGFSELRDLGLIDEVPRLFAAQAGGCAPIARAWSAGDDVPGPWDQPDTIAGPLEIPDPAGGERVLAALAATDGAAIGTGDEAMLEGGVRLAERGIAMSTTGGAAVSGCEALVDQGAFDGDADVVLVNTVSGNKEADLLRSYLMGQGI